MKFQELKVPFDQYFSLLEGKTNKVKIKARANCKYLTQYLNDQEYISNVLSGCGASIHHEYASPYGWKDQVLKLKNEEIYYKISRVYLEESNQGNNYKFYWILTLSGVNE